MKSPNTSKRKKKTVKAWAVLQADDGEISTYPNEKTANELAIMEGDVVVPCTITYEI